MKIQVSLKFANKLSWSCSYAQLNLTQLTLKLIITSALDGGQLHTSALLESEKEPTLRYE
jgi:hypothetical protein